MLTSEKTLGYIGVCRDTLPRGKDSMVDGIRGYEFYWPGLNIIMFTSYSVLESLQTIVCIVGDNKEGAVEESRGAGGGAYGIYAMVTRYSRPRIRQQYLPFQQLFQEPSTSFPLA